MMLRSDERCIHPSGQHPYHYSKDRQEGQQRYEDFYCGHCDELVRSVRVK